MTKKREAQINLQQFVDLVHKAAEEMGIDMVTICATQGQARKCSALLMERFTPSKQALFEKSKKCPILKPALYEVYKSHVTIQNKYYKQKKKIDPYESIR
jgi:hypothetical protein